jgi:hypothetical protein
MNLSRLRELAERATPGPWQWFGNTKMSEVYLATVDRGRIFVMDFVRWGMGCAQPRFQVRIGEQGGIMRKLSELDGDNAPTMVASHRKEFVGIGHPDAAFIAAARSAVPELIDECERLATLHGYEQSRSNDARADLDIITAQLSSALAESTRLRDELKSMTRARNEACDGWESLWRSDNNDEPPAEIAALRKVGQP